MQKTKMIFTIGPASDNETILTEFIKIGMNVARLNFSHGTHETHKNKIELTKKIRTTLNTPTAIMLDIKGPKIRTHNFINDGVVLEKGQEFSFHSSFAHRQGLLQIPASFLSATSYSSLIPLSHCLCSVR